MLTPVDCNPGKLWPELSAHIDEMLAFTDGRLEEWDVVNHIVGWGDTMATVCELSAFLGDYEIVVEHAGRAVTTKATVDKSGRAVTIKL